jgi:hypothetical protein
MRVSIMQPYFLPYIGYFQLINASDLFVIYDDVQFTKRGWINRNRIYTKNQTINFTIPCKSAPEKTVIRDKVISPNFNRRKLLTTLSNNLRQNPHFNAEVNELLSVILLHNDDNLFKYTHNSVLEIANFLGIKKKKIVISSNLGDFSQLRSQEKVIAICRELNASVYLNPISGIGLYESASFRDNGIILHSFEAKVAIPLAKSENSPPSIIQTISEIAKIEIEALASKGTIHAA